MNEHIVLAARIDWSGGVIQVTDTTLRIDAALFEDGQFEPRILGDVRWAESARHPYQQQAGELVVGNLSLANADGGLDALATGDVVGAEVELRRGSDADRWADLEFVFVARVSGVRLNGRSEIVLELENVLADLAGPVFADKFDDTVPNPQLEGKDIPLVIGRVKQAPVLEFDPTQLTYYTAENTSKIGQVAEGGNPTQRWTLEDQPTFALLGSPSLPITADFEGPGDALATLVDDNLNTWESVADVILDSIHTSQGIRPVGWKLIVGKQSGSNTISATQSSGLLISGASGILSASTVPFTVSDALSVEVQGSTVKWTNPSNALVPAGVTTIDTSSASGTDAIQLTVDGVNAIWSLLSLSGTVASGSIELEYFELYDIDDNLVYRAESGRPIGGAGYIQILTGLWSSNKPNEIDDVLKVRLKFSDTVSGQYDISQFYITSGVGVAPTVHLRRDLSMISEEVYGYEFDYVATGECNVFVGSGTTEESWPDTNEYLDTLNSENVFRLSGSGTIKGTLKANGGVFSLSYNPRFDEQTLRFGDLQITRIKVVGQKPGTTKYASAVPYILETAGIDPDEHLDQASINAHATAAGDTDLGWLIRGDETVDQVLFRLAGSLGGYVWHGLDGKVRSKYLELPADPGDAFLIDSGRTDIDEINAYDDPAPGLTTRVNALRNWQPIPPDRQAGITSTWTESDRAAAAADWRITRVYAADADFKRRWPAVASRDPYPSALLTGTDAQTLANQAGLWANRPRFYELPVELMIGELASVAVGEVVRVDLDYPGLDNVFLLVLGREGGARPGTVNLTLWG